MLVHILVITKITENGPLKQQTTGKLPNDCMEFVRTKHAAIIASDALYSKQRKEAVAEHKAWQTMDSSKHPLVLKAQLAWMLQSDQNYRKDANIAMDDMFFTADQTEFYNQQINLNKLTSHANYTRDANKAKVETKFNYADTEGFAQAKSLKPIYSNTQYTAKAKAIAEKPLQEEQTTEMIKGRIRNFRKNQINIHFCQKLFKLRNFYETSFFHGQRAPTLLQRSLRPRSQKTHGKIQHFHGRHASVKFAESIRHHLF